MAADAQGDLEGAAAALGILQTVTLELERIGGTRTHGTIEDPIEAWGRAKERIGFDMAHRGEMGLGFGIPPLDAAMNPGMRRGALWIIGGGTGEGKSCMGLSAALRASHSGRGTLFLSFEMPTSELLERAACAETGIPARRLQCRSLDSEHIEALEQWTPPAGLLMVMAAGLFAERIPTIVREAKARLAADGTPLGLVVVDHLQLVHTEARHEIRAYEVKSVVCALKEIALQEDLAVLALSQLSRAREKSKPAAWDLKESGAIEETGDGVLLLARERDGSGHLTNQAKVRLAKHRGGPAGFDVELEFDPHSLTFRGAQ
jgi:replicative DNA helicase